MHNDLDLIVKQYPDDMNVLRVYAIGDVHVGSPQFDEKAIKKKIHIIQDDPNAVVCVCGDLADFGLRTSKTNPYKATLQPKEQIEYVYELFKPIAHKFTAVVPGNHEERITKEVGLCPLYDLCVRWGVPEVYRENLAITKYSFGRCVSQSRQNTFVGITTHGSTRNKHRRFIACFDNVDFAISGHTHTPEYSPHGKIRINSKANKATHVPYKEIVVDASMTPGGYAIKHEYEIAPPPELQYLELSIYREPGGKRSRHKVMDYHAIQIQKGI